MKKKVCIIGAWGKTYRDMFIERGFTVTSSIKEAGIVVFTGGADIDPSYYGQKPHPQTRFNPRRDSDDKFTYNIALEKGLVMAGICRGGQFLNVMNGGSMYQHVDGHTRQHWVVDTLTGNKLKVTSTHHQMMVSGDGSIERAIAAVSTHQEFMPDVNAGEKRSAPIVDERIGVDTEVVIYPKTKSLCFQPHPELVSKDHPCQDYFFNLLDELVNP